MAGADASTGDVTDAERAQVLAVLASPPYQDLAIPQVWARARTRRAKADGSLAVVGRRILATTPPDAPPRTLAQIASSGARTKRAALVASNVGTMRGPFSIAGREVSTLIGMPPLFVGRQHLSVALFGLGAQLCAGFAASASVPRHAELADLWLTELAALNATVTVGDRAHHPTRRG